jgi:hypothetical protein
MPAARDFAASVRLPSEPRAVALDGAAVTGFAWDGQAKIAEVRIPACGAKPRVLTFETGQ